MLDALGIKLSVCVGKGSEKLRPDLRLERPFVGLLLVLGSEFGKSALLWEIKGTTLEEGRVDPRKGLRRFFATGV